MPDILLAALSARALAAAARRAGLKPLVLDLFGDEDTRAYAAETTVLRRGSGFTIDPDDLLARLAPHAGSAVPLVLGSGFEALPDLVDALAGQLAGTGGAALRQVKDPFALDKLLTSLDIPHPRVFAREAPTGVRTLAKAIGGSGGSHIRPARRVRRKGRYLQERIEGRTVSALFLSDGHDARLLGFSEQWCAPSTAAPYRYGGAAGPVDLPPVMEREVTDALRRLAGTAGLLGLASADLMLTAEGWQLVEINPRPGATLDIFDHPPLPPLLRLHLDACAGRLPELAPRRAGMSHGARAAGVLYAPVDFELQLEHLPAFAADRPAFGTRLRAGEPVCTIMGEGRDADAARRVMQARMDSLWDQMQYAGRQAAE